MFYLKTELIRTVIDYLESEPESLNSLRFSSLAEIYANINMSNKNQSENINLLFQECILKQTVK